MKVEIKNGSPGMLGMPHSLGTSISRFQAVRILFCAATNLDTLKTPLVVYCFGSREVLYMMQISSGRVMHLHIIARMKVGHVEGAFEGFMIS